MQPVTRLSRTIFSVPAPQLVFFTSNHNSAKKNFAFAATLLYSCNRLQSIMSRHKTTLKDIAKELNVTPSTVSRALNDHPGISDATKQAVIAAAERLQYHPNQIAAALRSGRSYIIGVLVPSADRSFFPSVIRGIEDEVNKHGYSVIVGQTYEETSREKQVINTLLRTRVDGIIVSPAKQTLSVEHLERIKEEGIPLVLFDNTIPELGVSTVRTDDFRGAYLATEHLIRQGRQRILHLAGPQSSDIYRERLRGYRQALNDHAISIRESLIIDCPSDVKAGRDRVAGLLAGGEKFDAIFSTSDYAALGAMQYLKSKKINVPKAVSIVGFGNAPFTAYVTPALSTVDQNGHKMGEYAARIFLEQLQAKPVIRRHTMPAELIIRRSSAE